MFVIMGATGRVGGQTARTLLATGRMVRIVARNPAKAEILARKGAQIALAAYNDAKALTTAFRDAAGVFVMLPNGAPGRDSAETRAVLTALRTALATARPARVVCLSSIGAHRQERLGLITPLHLLEQTLGDLPLPLAFIRAGWFMENSFRYITPASRTGEIISFLSPPEREIPMVATIDIGRLAAQTLQEEWTGRRIIEIEGPRRYAPNDLAQILEKRLGRSVNMTVVPRDQWEDVLRARGTANPAPQMEMLDGCNSGWIDFEGGRDGSVKGKTPLDTVLARFFVTSRTA